MEVIRMETKLKDKLIWKGLSGRIKNVEAIYQRITKISAKALDGDGVSFVPYETSQEYRAHMDKVERERFQALAETRRHLLSN